MSDSNAGIAERKTMHADRSGDLDDVLYKWFKQRRSEGVPITGPLICEKAKELHKELNMEVPYSFSSRCLTRFKHRHGIMYLKTCGEKLSAEEFIDYFTNLVKEELSSEQIYNMDETGLFWRSLPQKTLATSDEKKPSGVKEDKQRITVLVCSNATGTHKCMLLVVGKSVNPHPLKNGNKKAWVTREMIIECFKNNFVAEVHEHNDKMGLSRQ